MRMITFETTVPHLVLRGTRSSATVSDDGAIEVRDDTGAVRVRFDGDTAVICGGGDLELEAAEGSIRLEARDDVVIEAGRDITQRAAGTLKHEAPIIEIHADQLFERTRDTIHEVRELLLTRAGRVRSLVRDGFSLLSRRTVLKSEKSTSIDGERVLLG